MPLDGAKLRQACEVTLVRREHCDATASRTCGNQRVVRQPRPSDSLVSILLRQPGEDFPGLGPIAQIWDENPSRSLKIALQLFQDHVIVWVRSCEKLLQYNGTKPEGRLLRPALQQESSIATRSESGDVQG